MHRLRFWQAAATAAIPLGLFGDDLHSSSASPQGPPPGAKLERVHASKVVDAANEDSLSDRHVLLYFAHTGAHPVAVLLQPRIYEIKSEGEGIEIVFISSDETEAAARQYMTEHMGEWLMVPFDDPLRWASKSAMVSGQVQNEKF